MISELEKLLARLDISVQQVADALGVDVDDLAGLRVTLADLESIGLSEEVLALLGVTLADLRRAGIDVGD